MHPPLGWDSLEAITGELGCTRHTAVMAHAYLTRLEGRLVAPCEVIAHLNPGSTRPPPATRAGG